MQLGAYRMTERLHLAFRRLRKAWRGWPAIFVVETGWACTLSARPVAPHSRFYYAIENLDSGSVVRRGLTSSNGIPGNGLILSPNTRFREWLFQAESGFIGFSDFRTPASGSRFTIPPITLHPPLSPDTDGDGLSDDAEFIVGSKMINSADFYPPQIDLG